MRGGTRPFAVVGCPLEINIFKGVDNSAVDRLRGRCKYPMAYSDRASLYSEIVCATSAAPGAGGSPTNSREGNVASQVVFPQTPRVQHGPLDADRPQHPWLYGSVALDGEGMSIEIIELVADPQTPSGWRPHRIDLQQYRGITQLPLIWYASDGAAFGEGDLPHLGLAHQYLNHFRCQSGYQELLYRTALPVGCAREWLAPWAMGAAIRWCWGPTA